MDLAGLYHQVADKLDDDLDAATLTHAVLIELAERLTPEEAAELGAELPDELGDVLARASGDGELKREEFVEALAARLDVDDDAAESGAVAVLSTLREYLEPIMSIEQVMESLPPDLAQMMAIS
ncbi:MAG TPA: DUF2267 domain-containing protein [Polyangia bacterium]|nr:DUF2267 domain-containing protein [Polyangia bacterium]